MVWVRGTELFNPYCPYCFIAILMFHMQLLHAKGIANLSYVVHAYVLVTYDMNILTLCDIIWLCLNIMRFVAI